MIETQYSNSPSDGEKKMPRELTDRQYLGFAMLNQRQIVVQADDMLLTDERNAKLDALKKMWHDKECSIGKRCNRDAVAYAGFDFFLYREAMLKLTADANENPNTRPNV